MLKKIKNYFHEIGQTLKKESKSTVIVYFVLRILVILCMVLQIIGGDLNNAFLCLLTLILFLLPFFIEKKFSIDIPETLEIIILSFIFSAEILGEINNFYNIIPFWDTILHTMNGFLCAAIGFALVELLNNNSNNFKLSPLYLVIVAFCFSMTIGVVWEFFEFGADNFVRTSDMQKDRYITKISSVLLNDNKENKTLHADDIAYTILYDENNQEIIRIEEGYLDIGLIDTMKDLVMNFIGAFIFCVIGYLSIKSENKYHTFIQKFTPKKTSPNH